MKRKRRASVLAAHVFMGAVSLLVVGALSAQVQGDAPYQPQDIVQADLPDGSAENALNDLIAQRLGMRQPYRVEEEGRLGNSFNNVRKAVFDDDSQRISVVIKGYSDGHRAWRKRFREELEMNAAFRAAGLRTLDYVVAVPNKGIAVTRFLEDGISGTEFLKKARSGDLASLGLVESLGRGLATAHRNNLCVRDLKPDNVMASQEEIVFIDLDKATHCGGQAVDMLKTWDVAWFFYRAVMGAPQEEQGPVVNAFVKGYLGSGGSARVVRKAAALRYASMAWTNAQIRDAMKTHPEAFERLRHEISMAAQTDAQ